MRYHVRHVTEYEYHEAVPLSHSLLHLRPRTTPTQRCLTYDLTIQPRPADLRSREDFFGNTVNVMTIDEPHHLLRIEARSVVEVGSADDSAMHQDQPWEAVADELAASVGAGSLESKSFLYPTALTPDHPAITDFARRSFTPGRGLFESASDLSRRIFTEFRFDPRATTVSTPVLDVLRQGRGVCQDFAHLAVASLRSLRLPARYVSGYVLTRPPPDQPRLAGADASHAWVSVFVPGRGWTDFDPTNGVQPQDQHVTVAWGRDYDDVCPVRGVTTGGHGHRLRIAVDVEPIAGSPR
jgi:transglutaminase-like putative cysteine protease